MPMAGVYCCANGCSNNNAYKGESGDVSFHKFPDDDSLKLQWTSQIARDCWQPSKYSVLCSDHFTTDCFIKGPIIPGFSKRRRLLPTAIPTIFNRCRTTNDRCSRKRHFDVNWLDEVNKTVTSYIVSYYLLKIKLHIVFC